MRATGSPATVCCPVHPDRGLRLSITQRRLPITIHIWAVEPPLSDGQASPAIASQLTLATAELGRKSSLLMSLVSREAIVRARAKVTKRNPTRPLSGRRLQPVSPCIVVVAIKAPNRLAMTFGPEGGRQVIISWVVKSYLAPRLGLQGGPCWTGSCVWPKRDACVPAPANAKYCRYWRADTPI